MAVADKDGMRFYNAWQKQRTEVEFVGKHICDAIDRLETAKGEANKYSNDAASSVIGACQTAIDTLNGIQGKITAAMARVDGEADEAKARYEAWYQRVLEDARKASATHRKNGSGPKQTTK